jgi:hypothetical protein
VGVRPIDQVRLDAFGAEPPSKTTMPRIVNLPTERSIGLPMSADQVQFTARATLK